MGRFKIIVVLLISLFVVLGIEPRALHLLGKHCTIELEPQLQVTAFQGQCPGQGKKVKVRHPK
jgi:hypothetical protein